MLKVVQHRVEICSWIPPPLYLICINTDGFICDIGAGFGFIVRGNEANLLYGRYGPSMNTDINLVELTCIGNALQWAVQGCYCRVILFSNSKLAVDCINGEVEIPWRYLKMI